MRFSLFFFAKKTTLTVLFLSFSVNWFFFCYYNAYRYRIIEYTVSVRNMRFEAAQARKETCVFFQAHDHDRLLFGKSYNGGSFAIGRRANAIRKAKVPVTDMSPGLETQTAQRREEARLHIARSLLERSRETEGQTASRGGSNQENKHFTI